MAQPVLLLDLADVGGQSKIVEDVRDPARKVAVARVIAERIDRVIRQQRCELF